MRFVDPGKTPGRVDVEVQARQSLALGGGGGEVAARGDNASSSVRIRRIDDAITPPDGTYYANNSQCSEFFDIMGGEIVDYNQGVLYPPFFAVGNAAINPGDGSFDFVSTSPQGFTVIGAFSNDTDAQATIQDGTTFTQNYTYTLDGNCQ
jgi:hypothetical protein